MEWYLLNHWDQWFFDGFFSQPTIGDNVFQWLQTIGLTMRWKRYIVPVYLDVYTSDVWVNSSMRNGRCNLVPLFHRHLICMICCQVLIDGLTADLV